MAVITINGVGLPSPTLLSFGVMDLDSESSVRTADGVMHRERIATKRKISITWKNVTMQEASIILNAVSPVSFSATFPDALAGGFSTAQMYVGDRDSSTYFDTDTGRWKEIRFDLIEI